MVIVGDEVMFLYAAGYYFFLPISSIFYIFDGGAGSVASDALFTPRSWFSLSFYSLFLGLPRLPLVTFASSGLDLRFWLC